MSSSLRKNSPALACPCSSNGAVMFDIDDFLNGSARSPSREAGRSVSDPIVAEIVRSLYKDPRVTFYRNSRDDLVRYLRSHTWQRDPKNKQHLVCERCQEIVSMEGTPATSWNLRMPIILKTCSEQLMERVLSP